jgi:hypothetical protein
MDNQFFNRTLAMKIERFGFWPIMPPFARLFFRLIKSRQAAEFFEIKVLKRSTHFVSETSCQCIEAMTTDTLIYIKLGE